MKPARTLCVALAATLMTAISATAASANHHRIRDWNASVNATTSGTTAAQAVAAGDRLVAYVAADGPNVAGQQTATVTGCGLTWALLARQNAQLGDSEAWTSTAAAANSACQVTVTAAVTGYPVTLTAADYGAAGTPTATTAHASTGAAAVTVSSVPSGSALWLVGNDYDNAISRTWLPGNANVHQWLSPTGDTYWVEDAASAVSGTVTIGTSAPSTDEWNAVAVIVPPPPSPPAPVADFTATPLSGTTPLNVTFTDTSTNTPTSWSWTFGDGATSTAQNPTHSYAAAGTYTVSLTASNANGSNTVTRTNYVTATAPSSGTCAPYPAFPDASCTGPTGVMANYSGPMNITTPGAVIQNVVIHTTGITVSANNVTFRNCRIIYSGTTEADYGLVEANPVTGTVFDHCEIDGKGLVKDGIHGGDNFSVTGCNIHDVGNGVEAGWAFTVRESYIWNIYTPNGYTWHADGVQAWDGTHDMLIDHNTILMPTANYVSGVVDFVGTTPQHNNLVQHNLMAGGGYTVYVGSSTSNTNVQVINNHYSTRYWPKVGTYNIYYYGGPAPGGVVSGNVIDETGAPADTNI